jgi:hypothetical protein
MSHRRKEKKDRREWRKSFKAIAGADAKKVLTMLEDMTRYRNTYRTLFWVSLVWLFIVILWVILT